MADQAGFSDRPPMGHLDADQGDLNFPFPEIPSGFAAAPSLI